MEEGEGKKDIYFRGYRSRAESAEGIDLTLKGR